MEKIWLKNYPAGVPAEIDLSEYASLNHMFTRSCRKFADLPAFRSMGCTITYRQLERLVRDFAACLQNLEGLEPGSRVALMMPNILQYPVALFGILRAGMMVVNVNPLYTPRELRHQLKDSGAEAIVVLENFAHVVEQVLPDGPVKYVVTTQVGDLLEFHRRSVVNFAVRRVKKMVKPWRIPHAVRFRTALSRGARSKFAEVEASQDDIAFLQYTGGTTGVSKGAMLTHRNMIANLLQAKAWIYSVLEDGREIGVTALPLYHVFSLTMNCLLGVQLGALNNLVANPRDIPGLINEMKKNRFTLFTGVNTLYNALLNNPELGAIDFRRVKLMLAGGAAVQRAVAERWRAATGKPIVEGYGLTETSPFVTSNLLDSEYNGSIGMPLPSTDVSIRDDDGREVALGEEGEIWVRGPQVMKGYWHRPEETSNTITSDGWLRTGDVGRMDRQGLIRITDRKKDMILVSGFNVYPNEVESVLASHPGVLECAVIGVPDPVTGEAVKAFVIAKDPELKMESLVQFCRQNLTNYKVPKLIEFRTELPKSPIGKILRRELRTAREEEEAKARTQQTT
jgi:long-chain acyl-CoA synthetase